MHMPESRLQRRPKEEELIQTMPLPALVQRQIEEEERKDLEEAEAAKAEKEATDEKWMLKQLKEEFGDDFGDDISTDFKG